MLEQSPKQRATSQSPLQTLPPSAKLVAKTLEYEGELTQAQLIESTRLAPRTVRHALSKLEAEDLIESRPALMDARKQIYSLKSDRTT